MRKRYEEPVSAEPVAHAMEAIMGYRLEFKPGEYCYYTPEGYDLEAYKGDAPAHALYANPQPGCPSEVEVYKGWCWVRPKYNSGNIVDETFRPLFLGPQLGAPVAAQVQPAITTREEYIALLDYAIETGKRLNIAWEDAFIAAQAQQEIRTDADRAAALIVAKLAEIIPLKDTLKATASGKAMIEYFTSALAQQDADKVDAERYRALRGEEVMVSMTLGGNTGSTPWMDGAELDKCADSLIDAARKEDKA